MRIVLFTQYYFPESVAIPHELAKGLVRRGHSVVSVTGFPNYPHGKVYDGYKQKLWQMDEIDGVKVIRLPVYPDHSFSIIKRFTCFLSLAITSSLFGPIFSGPVDVIFVFHTLTLGFPALLLGLFRNCPIIFNLQDMYPESLTTVKMSKNSLIYRSVNRVANFIYEKSTAISVLSPGFKKHLIMKGVNRRKIHIIYNWADGEVYMPNVRDEQLAFEWGMKDRFNVVFAGNMGPPQGLHNVIEAARILSDVSGIQFVLIGDGIDKESLVKAVRSHNLQNVCFIPRQPVSKMPGFYALADALLVHLIDEPLFEITIPGKTQGYLACGKPILMSVKGDAANLVLEAGAGLVARPSDPLDLANAVRELYKMPLEQRTTMGANGRKFFLENLTIEGSLDKYETLFQKVIIDNQ